MTEMSVPFLNRLVDRMFMHADPKADQNLWDLARAAEEVMRAVKGEQLTAAYGAPATPAAQELTEQQCVWISQYGATGRISNSPVPPVQPPPIAQGMANGEIELLLVGDPDAQGSTMVARVQSLVNAKYEQEKRLQRAEAVVKLADAELNAIGRTEMHGTLNQRIIQTVRGSGNDSERREQAEKALRQLAHTLSPQQPIDWKKQLPELAEHIMIELRGLREELTTAKQQLEEANGRAETSKNVLAEVREKLDPDGRLEAESLRSIARVRMVELNGAKQSHAELKTKLGTQIEEHSAEALRKALGAQEGETLGQTAQRVGVSFRSAPEREKAYTEAHQAFRNEVRDAVGARGENDDWDNPCPEQPTLDAVRRVVARVVTTDSHVDGSRTQEELLDDIQQGWCDSDHKELDS